MENTPGIEEGGLGRDNLIANAKNDLRNDWRKLVESEERLGFFRRMVKLNLQVREIQHLGDNSNNKLRSEKMKNANSEKEVVRQIMDMKLKDERRHQREVRKERNEKRRKLEEMLSKTRFKSIISQINGESKRWKKLERGKYDSKIEHLRKIRREEDEKTLEECPIELEKFKQIKVFSKKEMMKLKKEEVKVSKIGEVELDSDE